MITSVYENSTIKKSLDKWHTKNNSAIIALSQGESPHLWLKKVKSENLWPRIDTANSRRHQAMFTEPSENGNYVSVIAVYSHT